MARLDAAAEKEMGPDPRAGLANDAAAKEICAVVAGEKGLRSELRSDREAAVRAAFAVARLNPAVALDALLPVAKDLCDVAEHDEIGPNEIKIFNTQIGRLSTDPVDVFKAEVRVNANGPRKARGKSRMDYGSDSDDDAPVARKIARTQHAGRAVLDSITIPSEEMLDLTSNHLLIELSNLKRPFRKGETVSLALSFLRGRVPIEAHVH